ncbi:CbiX/SirB N-terminal domain-containing protein [Donghicola mangrovi]|uniref:Cobalamin biosynthesis protein CbiX n=1 Tax=Donghicola mangrovi TaxID=2729614 RepID=A0A850QEJ5_9RHOB|nr:CbiX/SirB N-terminal domain-containing protein [Donghicola mangrovi]NVO25368.1 cobalamin biosynthesis protein CbiX [Donghicola mangrovi]
MARATEQAALIVAHGSPSDPDGQEAALAALAAKVGRHLPGWRIGSATLAAEGCFERACAGLGHPLILPFFMARGWFTQHALPRRAGALRQLAPFGMDPALPAMLLRRLSSQTSLLLAAHGSARSTGSAEATALFAERLRTHPGCPPLRVGFLEEAPHVAEVARHMPEGSACLPLFALASGHVSIDLPQALHQAGFTGRVLQPAIAWPETPGLIAAQIESHRSAARGAGSIPKLEGTP